ncbi:MAG: tetratricopeptide repeat protein [Phycisphaerales bacterium]
MTPRSIVIVLGLLAAAAIIASCHSSSTPRSSSRADAAATLALGPDDEALSLLGQPLKRSGVEPDKRIDLEKSLVEATKAHTAAPNDERAAIEHGRCLCALGRYREAIGVYSVALESHPDSPWLLRYRGHRYITTRQLDLAERDLRKAESLIKGQPDQIDPEDEPADGARSSLHTSVYYHLGIALYLRGKFDDAERAFDQRNRLKITNDDLRVATAYWRWLCLKRLARDADAKHVIAPITPGLDVRENKTYYRLGLLINGYIPESDLVNEQDTTTPLNQGATYGVAMLRKFNGDDPGYHRLLLRIVEEPSWINFGRIAAEAEIAREEAP